MSASSGASGGTAALNGKDGDSRSAADRLAQEARQFVQAPASTMRDITADFIDACNQLEAGQLIKDEYFTLFEAVGALEIMDAKMDTGLVVADEDTDPDIYPADDMSPQELIWTLDELIGLEIAWLEDYPLSQTIFTSIHIDRILDPDNRHPYHFELLPTSTTQPTITNQILHPYCLALIKCSSMVLELARSQGFYEEEDFISHTFGRDLVPDLTHEECIARLDEALLWLSTLNSDAKIKTALQARLHFRKLFIESIFGQINGWHGMTKLLINEIEESRKLGAAKPACFSTKVLRRLATSTPPRPDVKTSWSETRQKWQKLCNDVAEAPQLTSFWIRQSPTSLQRALWAFAARRPGTLARSIIQDIVFVDGKIADDVSHFDLLLTDLREFVLPGHHLVDPDSFQIEAVSNKRHKCSRLMESFLDGMLDEYLNLFRLLCQNRARIRRHATQSITIMDTLEKELASKYDAELEVHTIKERFDTVLGSQQALQPLLTWTRSYKLKIMADSVLLGFETDIYLPDELAHMYWYLSNLLKQRRTLIEHVEVFTKARATALNEARDSRHLAECLVALQWYTALTAELDVGLHLAKALHTLYALLLHLKLIRPPARSFADPLLLHEARMKIYMNVTIPPCPSVEDFELATTLNGTIAEAFEKVELSIQAAKTNLATLKRMPADVAKYAGTELRWKSEIKQLEASAVAVSVACTVLKRAHSTASKSEQWQDAFEVNIPLPGKRYHDWWVVPQIKAKR